MSFTPNMPLNSQSLGQTVDAVRNNYLNYFNVMGVNHVSPNKIGAGKHKFIQFRKQTTSATTGKNEVALYNKNNALFFRPESNGTEFQISGNPVNVSSGSTGFSIALQDGNIMKFGSIVATVNVPQSVDYAAVCGSAFSLAPFSVKVQGTQTPIPANRQNEWVITLSDAAQFTFLPTLSGAQTYYFIAIGE